MIDVTERERATELHSVVMQTIAEGLMVLDAGGRLVLMNPAATKMLGWSEEELRGEVVHPIIHFQRADGSELPEAESELLEVRRDASCACTTMPDLQERVDHPGLVLGGTADERRQLLGSCRGIPQHHR